jgi:hypothetical protein
MRWAEHVTRIGAKRNANRVLVEKPQRNRPHGRPRRRWEDNIKVNLKEKAWERVLDSRGSGHGHVASFCEHGIEPSCHIKTEDFVQSRTYGFSRRTVLNGVDLYMSASYKMQGKQFSLVSVDCTSSIINL